MHHTDTHLPPSRTTRLQHLRAALRRRYGARVVPTPAELRQRQPVARKPHLPHGLHGIALAIAGLLMALALAPRPARAGTLDVDINMASIHTERWARRQLNQHNPGIGIAYHVDRTWAVMGGEYKNSFRWPTWYALAAYTPLQLGRRGGWHVDAGIAAGLASGYRRSEVGCEPAAAAAVIEIRDPAGVGINLLAIPNQGARQTGFVGLQLAIPI